MQAVVLLLDASPGLRPVGGGALLPLGPQKLIDVTLGWLERSGLCEVSPTRWPVSLRSVLAPAGLILSANSSSRCTSSRLRMPTNYPRT